MVDERSGHQFSGVRGECPAVTDGGRNSYERVTGYRGIWFELGQVDGDVISGEYGDKYSGGLGTYTSKHLPMAVHAPDVEKTFFTYGATRHGEQNLLIVASYYDHATHEVPRPTVVDPKSEEGFEGETVTDPHDNATLLIDDEGYLWIFVSGRGMVRPGRIYRSESTYSVASFERLHEWEKFAYPQPWLLDGRFVLCFTIYDEEWTRELFWRTSPDGRAWSLPSKLVGIDGHYQLSNARDGTLVTVFNWHPDGDPDRRTNLYALRTDDQGETWRTLDGTAVETPVVDPDNEALLVNYEAQEKLVYLNDLVFDPDGNPMILYVTSNGHAPGPENGPRRWKIARWTDDGPEICVVAESDHNYDSGSLYIRDHEWFVVGPTETGPQPHHTGGEMVVWRSADNGATWQRTQVFPAQDGHNATYARRPKNATAPFEAFWADGDASQFSTSRLYFGSLEGGYWQLPYDMDASIAEPVDLSGRNS